MSQPTQVNDLIARLQAGDSAAWNLVIDKMLPKVLAAVERRYGRATTAPLGDDLGQSLLRRLCCSLRQDAPSGEARLATSEKLLGWLIRAGHNRCVDLLRKTRRERANLPDLLGRRRTEKTNAATDLLEELSRESAEQLVRQLEDKLHDSKDVIIFRGKLAGKTEVELAEELQCSDRSIRSQWAKITERLRKLAEEGDGREPPAPKGGAHEQPR